MISVFVFVGWVPTFQFLLSSSALCGLKFWQLAWPLIQRESLVKLASWVLVTSLAFGITGCICSFVCCGLYMLFWLVWYSSEQQDFARIGWRGLDRRQAMRWLRELLNESLGTTFREWIFSWQTRLGHSLVLLILNINIINNILILNLQEAHFSLFKDRLVNIISGNKEWYISTLICSNICGFISMFSLWVGKTP